MKKVLLIATVFVAGLLVGQKTFEAPSTVLHVVTVRWTKDSTPAQRQAALDGVRTMAQNYPGIKRVWLKSIKVQPSDYSAAFVMEFADRKALEDYVQAPAHAEWKKLYDPVHDQSTTHDITN
ncbi:MAG: Stress responsive Barrel Domain protein [Bryobacterales bacterium]|nr:Stress responsive Barrel Domain protein [Bryobacterales bacterium]